MGEKAMLLERWEDFDYSRIQNYLRTCELLDEGEIHWTGGEVGHRNSTNPLAKLQIGVYMGTKSALDLSWGP